MSVRFAALALGYMNGESDWINILSNVSILAFKSCFNPLPELSLQRPPTQIHTQTNIIKVKHFHFNDICHIVQWKSLTRNANIHSQINVL